MAEFEIIDKKDMPKANSRAETYGRTGRAFAALLEAPKKVLKVPTQSTHCARGLERRMLAVAETEHRRLGRRRDGKTMYFWFEDDEAETEQ